MWQKENACWWNGEQVAATLTSRNSGGAQRMPDKENFMAVIVFRKQGHPQNSQGAQGWEETNVSDTLNVYDNSESRTPILVVDQGGGKTRVNISEDISPTLSTTHAGEPVILENHPADSRVKISKDGICQSLTSRMGTGGGNVPLIMENEEMEKENYSIVRRLTPLECERLQGFPDGWTDIGEWRDSKGKLHKDADSPRYKALGNSIALPFWDWMAGRMVEVLKKEGIEDPTMASLFDGIGGFPLVFSRHGCTPVWASEIEEFPIAVTKKRFPDAE